MKVLSTTFLFSFLLFQTLIFATHNRAGEIQIEQLNATTIQATIITFTNVSSVTADRDSLNLCWGDGNCEWVIRNSVEVMTNDYQKNIYQTSHSYSIADKYTISLTDPNRNGGILNVNFPESDRVAFHIETQFSMFENENNHAPVLLLPPVDIAFTNQLFFHNPNAFDSDGDSLSFELITPMSELGKEVPNYQLPDKISPSADNNISIDSETGQIIWNTPKQEGEYNIAIKIKEFRDGVQIGTMIRDMQILVIKMDDLPPTIELIEDNNTEAGFEIKTDITANHSSQKIKITATGGPFEVESNPATFTAPSEFQSGPITATFNWNTNETHIREQPYQVVFKVENDILGSSGSVVLKVLTIDVQDKTTPTYTLQDALSLTYFPNPAKHFINLDFRQIPSSDLELNLFNVNGQLIQSEIIGAGSKNHQINLSNVPTGIYFLELSNGKEKFSKRIKINP